MERSFSWGSVREYYFTLTIESADSLADEISRIEKRGLHIATIALYGTADPSVIAIAKKYPVRLVGNTRGRGPASATIQAFGGPLTCAYVAEDGVPIGAHISSGSYERLIVGGIGALSRGDFAEEAHRVYEKIGEILAERGFSPTSVYRYWNYMEDVLAHYSSFNDVRHSFFTAWGMTTYPAATGIEARLAGDSIRIGFEALRGAEITTLHSDLQSEAWSYGPQFSRGVVVAAPGSPGTKIFISGTSTVNEKGESVAFGNPRDAVRYVLTSIEHLLAKKGLKLSDIRMSVVYGTDQAILDAFAAIGVTDPEPFPVTAVLTTICRPDLEFEMECVAGT